ncbi:MAG: polysaccharide pyruvyl transferase CsaB [Clostridia bacterium]|nr:polysaccharide pyruvyl transferase CsaB [Clostridia bacterium]
MSDVVISGYYGFRNNGDDALLLSIINDLKSKKPDIDIVVLSKNPRETERIYKVRAVHRENVASVIKELLGTKMLISGGGTLMQDGTSTKSLLYYLWIIRAAAMFGKKVMLYANGIGPLNSERNRTRTKKVLNRVNLITLRDEASREELEKIGVTVPHIEVTADPAFRLEFDEKASDGNFDGDKDYMLVSVRPWKENSCDFCEALTAACDYAYEKYDLETVFLPMHTKTDEEITEKIRTAMRAKSQVLKTDYNINRLLSIFSGMKLCIGMRLHTLIYSAVTCVPLVGIVYDPKVSGFLDYIGISNYCGADTVTKETLISAIDRAMAENAAEREKLKAKRAEFGEKAKRNAELAINLLCGGEKF